MRVAVFAIRTRDTNTLFSKGKSGKRIVEQTGETKVKEVGNVPSAHKSGIMPKHE
jgi:hypothetical protein